MCGIIAITTSTSKNVSKLIIKGLQRLEYRGYDSVGIATINQGEIKLEKEGYSVLKAADGEQTVTLTKSENPDLILLDLIMPKKSGFDVLNEIKADPSTKDIPIIILSNLGQEEDVKKAAEAF